MDTETTQLLATATRRSLLRHRMDEARARFRELTQYGHNGGVFQITSALLLEVAEMVRSPQWKDRTPILLDAEGYPIEIANSFEFYHTIQAKYISALTRFNIDVKAARETYIPDLLDACVES